MSGSADIGRQVYQLGFEISPIILTAGIADLMPQHMLPIVAIIEAGNFLNSLLSGGTALSLDNFFAHFRPVSGGTLINNQVATYPFANQAVAGNAVIAQPLTVSLLMICPVKAAGGYAHRLATLVALKILLAKHVNLGGLFTVATPSFVYTNCVLTALRDVTAGAGNQVQVMWQWDFIQPLVTLADAILVENTVMQRWTQGLPSNGSLSGSLFGPVGGVVPQASPLIGTAIVPGAAP